ncbi:MAG TPA: hypothetical protein VF929_11545 [Gemmatimonadaceae bacterium]
MNAPAGSPDGAWELLLEELLRSLVHSINNRITAMSAFAELAALDHEPIDLIQLRAEIIKLHAIGAYVGRLAQRTAVEEALELSAVLELALSIHEHHPLGKSIPCHVEQVGAVHPVRVYRWALLRVLLLMVDAARREADARQNPAIVVRLTGDEDHVRMQVPTQEPPSHDLATFAALLSGTVTSAAGELTLTLPSLPAIRLRERAAMA